MLLLLKKRDEQKEIEEIENFLEKYERFEIATKLRELLSSKCLQKGYKQMVEEQVLHKIATALTGILRLQILLETKEETQRTFDFYESNINLLQHYQNNLTAFSSIGPSLQETFGFLFHDLKTDWAGIYEVFQWIKEWKTIPLHSTISFEYLEQITTKFKA